MEKSARRSLTEDCEIFHSSELNEKDWDWLKEKSEWFERHLSMIRNKIIIENSDWDDYQLLVDLCRNSFNDLWYITKEQDSYSRNLTITIYVLDKDELLKLKLTLEK